MVRLTAQQKKFYQDNGYLHLKNVFSKQELDTVIDEYNKLFKRKNEEQIENSWVGSNETNRINNTPFTVKGVHNLQYHNAIFGKVLYNENLLDALEDIMGPDIMLHHTKAHFKPPEKGAEYPMHQDYHYFPYEKDSPVAAFINLDPADYSNGGLCVYPGSHKLGPQEDFGAKEGNFHWLDKKKFPVEKATPVVAERGDVIIFHYLLIHGSPLNRSDRPRRMLLAQFVTPDDKPIGVQNMFPGFGWMMRGTNYSKDASVSTQWTDLSGQKLYHNRHEAKDLNKIKCP
ncbi:phytanoyl-CoA dioxygenase, peroxisomal-like [Plodia interpunctella]|uniref:phytanoyl-CoA dioxygenase, peroxisomal-like n=1 Tax=Plodia interpunctella TaxID=58824 RepID=UPI002367E5D0|nr:phytanoyl-CoA dioxygenase, peroxisomal-like [Plodia interpunctella]